jgi:hypothetical protein
MGLFDDYVDPQQFDSGGGLLGRLLALKPSQDQYQRTPGFDSATVGSQGTIAGPALPFASPELRQPQEGQLDPLTVCRLPSGEIVPYQDLGDGFGIIGGGVNGGLGIGAGRAATDMQMPTVPKLGGLAGGGRSGQFTSPASRVLRDITGYARYAPLRPFTTTASVGGSMAKALPFWGTILSFLDYVEMQNAPTCWPAT